MKSKRLGTDSDRKTFALIFDQGDEVMEKLKTFVNENHVTAASFTAIGAFSAATLAWFDWQTKDYKKIPIDEQVEVLMLAGDVSLKPDGQPQVHAHVVIGKADGSAHGGHLFEAKVRPTLELILTESPSHLRRKHDPRSGLALISVE
ncbi:MAG TPA: PPC domain-containing DNA-binding protein [Tepidisphaeraceae bacterium]|nr:PPC domain-containing DNA-binding protein [Tepidisphaeraceae bacterium]